MPDFLIPNWPVPAHVKACTTLRYGGVSQAPCDSFNLGKHNGDTLAAVLQNRAILKQALSLPSEPIWLSQIHSTTVISAEVRDTSPTADAAYTYDRGIVCVALTADCLPVLLTNQQGTFVAAIHAGWRGLVAGIIEKTVEKLECPSDQLFAWLGPAISQKAFEVGAEVWEAFILHDPQAAAAFIPGQNQKWFADLYTLARQRLQSQGVTAIYGGDRCTYTEPEHFFSYRRDGAKTGRLASLIWLNN